MYGLVRIVYNSISRSAERNTEMIRSARKLKTKFKDIRQSVAEAEKVQKFVKENSRAELAAKIQRTANYDKEFRAFINDFNEKHKTKITVLDVASYAREFRSLSKPGLKPNDLKILQEFRKRRLEMKAQKVMATIQDDETVDEAKVPYDNLGSDGSSDENHKKMKKDEDESESIGIKSRKDQQPGDENDGEIGDDQEEIQTLRNLIQKDPQLTGKAVQDRSQNRLRQGPLDINDEFYTCIIDHDSTTLVTTLNRVNSFRYLVFMANAGGVIAYGRGKGKDTTVAMQKAFMHCMQNLIALPLDPNLAVPEGLYARFQDYKLTIKPKTYFNSWGHPAAAAILSLCGLDHCSFKTVHTDTNNYGMLNSIFKAVTKNKTPQQISEREGFKVYRHQWVKPLPRPQGKTSFRK